MSPVLRAADKRRSTPSRSQRSAPAAERSGSSGGSTASWAKGGKRVPGSKAIVNQLLPGFSRQLAAMLSAGMPIVASMEALEEQAANPNFRIVISSVRESIENGAAFSEALRQFPSIFDTLYTNMIRGGETGGQLPETIARLASFLEASAKLKHKVKSALMYPSIVFCVAITIAIGMIVFIVPVFAKMFESMGGDLPGPTQFLMDLSNLIRKRGLFLIIGLVVIIVSFKQWKKTPSGTYAFDRFVLKTPVFGELARKVASSRFARTFGQLIRSGVPILSALDIVSGATGNAVAGRVVGEARTSLEQGDTLSSAMLTQTVFPSMLVRMLQAGEKTGKVDEMMDSIADYYDDEVETTLNGLTSLLEPLLMVFLGVIIGGIVVSMFLPVFKIGEIVQGG